ncbi:hypothetical protein GY45DRAFT_132840 [Cubamyces sp. BRFM 1775]|nr:hypothetical protein GY45DRAFT_132840 [Cubamyces sp. BRFM 1775]
MSDTIFSPFLLSPTGSAGSRLTLPSALSASSIATSNTSRAYSPHRDRHRHLPAAHAAMRELWDVRRRITALQAREKNSLIEELKRLGQPVPPTEGANSSIVSDQRVRTLEDELTALREDLNREQQARRVSEALPRAERVRRAELEKVMKDATRGCQQPFVVPALLDVLMKIWQMTGDALKDGHGSNVPMEL